MLNFETDEAGAKPVDVSGLKPRRALAKIKRELSDEELSSPGVQKMIIEALERVEQDNQDLQQFRDRFHASDKQAAILTERLQRSLGSEIVFGGCLAVGAAALGYAPVLWGTQPSGWIAISFGLIVMGIGIVARLVRS